MWEIRALHLSSIPRRRLLQVAIAAKMPASFQNSSFQKQAAAPLNSNNAGIVPYTNGAADSYIAPIDERDPEDLSPPRSACCPFALCSCCPPVVRSMIPGTLQKIQDWTHMALILGFVGSAVLTCKVLAQLLGQRKCTTLWCVEEVLVLMTLPAGFYIIKMIGTYDEEIQEKERHIAMKKKELSMAYDSLIASMDDLLGKAAESSATMAERSFESKRRDFQRFLERAEAKYSTIVATQGDTEMMLQQFRAFVQRWLAVFEECSVDPIHRPKRVVTDAELYRCRNIGQVASLTLERLKATEVRFISSQRDKDAKELKGFRRHVGTLGSHSVPTQAALPASQPLEIELAVQSRPDAKTATLSYGSGSEGEGSDTDSFSGRPKSWERKPQAPQERSYLPCDWLQVGIFGCDCPGCCQRKPEGFERTRRVFQCILCQVVILSRSHVMLMFGFCWTILIIGFEMLPILDTKPDIPMALVALSYWLCISVLLVRFEQIDVIQRLEREVNELAAESQRIEARKEQMVKFWNDMQQLTDLWLHRTVPRLDLLKEVQGHLEDAPVEDVLALMAGANTRLKDLENALPEIGLWRGDNELLHEERKKQFAERVERLCHEETLPKILHGINKVIEDRILAVEAGAAPDMDRKPAALALTGTVPASYAPGTFPFPTQPGASFNSAYGTKPPLRPEGGPSTFSGPVSDA